MKNVYNVLNLGAGWQSSRLLLDSCRGDLPKFDAVIFADTQWEPSPVYTHLEWLKTQAAAAGIPLVVVTAGNIRADGIEFRANRSSSDGKRFASIPVFVQKKDGQQGRVKRQCTREYKIDVVDRWIRRELLGLQPGRRIPKDVVIRQWFGISDDERQRAVFPGRMKKQEKTITGLYGPLKIEANGRWLPAQSREHVYPLLNAIYQNDRTITEAAFYSRPQTRQDCGEWLRANYPDRVVPRSACIGCPFRSNAEWKHMRDHAPEEFEDACQFDDAMRSADQQYASRRKLMVGTLYLHRQMVPLRMANLDGDGDGERGGGCGTLFDGQDGLCGV